jgi:hypothetical protein
MTWFKVDDTLHSHKKAKRAGPEAMGLWVLAGSWCADQLTDGWVPDYMITGWAPNGDELAGRLVRAGLWIPDEHDGEAGWWFHEWDERQPTREEVLQRRKADAERRARWRQARDQRASREAEHAASQNGSLSESRRDTPHESRSGSQEGSLGESVLPDPTRPDPVSSYEETTQSGPRKRGTRLPDDFALTDEMRDWARERRPGLDASVETEKFCNHWWSKPGKDGTKLDWNRTWRNWILNARSNGPPPVSRIPLTEARAQERINELHHLGDAGRAAAEAGLGFQWPNPPPDGERDGLSRKDWTARYGQRWIAEHKSELLAGMTRRPA